MRETKKTEMTGNKSWCGNRRNGEVWVEVTRMRQKKRRKKKNTTEMYSNEVVSSKVT